MYCKNCGAHLTSDDAKFCQNCGAAVRIETQYVYAQSPVQPKKKKSGKCIAGFVLGIVSIPYYILLIPGIVGLILSILGMRQAKREDLACYKLGVAGFITSIVGLVISISVWVVLLSLGAAFWEILQEMLMNPGYVY